MNAAATATPQPVEASAPRQVTLLELVQSICEITDNDREVVAVVKFLLDSGRVRLCGNFRESSAAEFD